MGIGWGGLRVFTYTKKAGYSSRTCLVSPLGMGSESEERPEQKVLYRAGGAGSEAEGLGLEKWKER